MNKVIAATEERYQFDLKNNYIVPGTVAKITVSSYLPSTYNYDLNQNGISYYTTFLQNPQPQPQPQTQTGVVPTGQQGGQWANVANNLLGLFGGAGQQQQQMQQLQMQMQLDQIRREKMTRNIAYGLLGLIVALGIFWIVKPKT